MQIIRGTIRAVLTEEEEGAGGGAHSLHRSLVDRGEVVRVMHHYL
jgi:hypothetical protein